MTYKYMSNKTKVTITISDETKREIKSIYGSDDDDMIRGVVHDIINRYMHVEYFTLCL